MAYSDSSETSSSESSRTHSPTPSSTSIVDSEHSIHRLCKCRCDPECNCSCPCRDHCICLSKYDDSHTCNDKCNKDCEYKHKGQCQRQCGSHKSYRNLVVCLDGTSNQFGHRNTNVVELHNRILKDDPDVPQLTFYSSGIGTYVPPSRLSVAHWLHNFDKVFAWSFKRLVEEAYRWIADHYQPGDRLFLFGFSRGAYQVRALAGMIEKLGLVFSGNKGLIPFAYELYSYRHKGMKIKSEAEAEALALNFKRTFARSVRVHFVGVWDTVSSVGIAQTKPLPLTKSASHICFFRHGLALDERRVKFLPEYLAGGRSPLSGNEHYPDEDPPNAKEVWFPGRHSDMCDLPLLWMENEAGVAGLNFAPRRGGVEWRWDDHHLDKPKNALGGLWWLVEFLPVKHLRYIDKESTTRYFCFQGGLQSDSRTIY
ncbi:uncharacterized protein EV420DRAFT_1274312 [Desarmillaria tabescens]|uniref:T6SS Phospholipase effector Tle1-like catalytic domain-containing protein n=1 Tax=Armillaria tabescens TaxID=1929756 RepID=A0AA39MYA7_ARMTA|nr:uncharacterized protein EV420DRAFT_1274312 [Desarmillaria tabescens]KAK0451426.1 hypothetical protein EV420DRAFT_1274312 [Desarmillaria tabescens]